MGEIDLRLHCDDVSGSAEPEVGSAAQHPASRLADTCMRRRCGTNEGRFRRSAPTHARSL